MPRTITDPDFISPSQAATIIGCHKETVIGYVDAGLLPAKRPLGRGRGKPILIRRTDAERFKRKVAEDTTTAK